MEYQKALSTIRRQLKDRRPQKLKVSEFKSAGVLLPLFEKSGEAHILLTLRSDTVETHKGQVSFPGGAREEQDKDLADTARRETFEEVGIPVDQIDIFAELDDFPTISDFMVTPYVGTIPYPYPINISADEVAAILEVPLALFLTDQHFEIKHKDYKGKTYPLYYYYFENAVIWGFTGFLINRFIEIVFGYNPVKAVKSEK